ncbi:MAG TPA: PilN domain-containing protein, partial [Candidatus Baltobacteraceae bacterium]|nr:PilN domain-containing protein [Candidatus Baltobacteraceae bacterium]
VVMQFNYVGASVPSIVERLRAIQIPDRLRSPLCAFVTVLVVVAAWWGIERQSLNRALAQQHAARVRLAESRAALARANVERNDADEMLELDRRLREIRLSGSRLAVRLADVANRVPARVWLTTLSQNANALDVRGRAESMARLGDAIGAFGSSAFVRNPTLVRADKEERSGAAPLVAFEVRADE